MIRLFRNGRVGWRVWKLRLIMFIKKFVVFLLKFLDWRFSLRNLLILLSFLDVRIRILLMRFMNLLINLVRVEEVCMRLRRLSVVLRWKKRSFRLFWKRLKVFLSRRKLKLCVFNLRLLLLELRLIDVFKRKKRNLIILDVIISVFLILCKLVWRLRLRVRLRLWGLGRSWSKILMNWRLFLMLLIVLRLIWRRMLNVISSRLEYVFILLVIYLVELFLIKNIFYEWYELIIFDLFF